MAQAAESIQATERRFRVTMTHHPSHFVSDLEGAQRFFASVFGRPSTPIRKVLERVAYVNPDFPRDYSAFTVIADVFFDCLDPSRLVMAGEATSRLVLGPELLEVGHPLPHLEGIGFAVEGQAEAYRALKRRGFTILNTFGEKQERALPTGPNDPAPFFTLREETGTLYEFYPAGVFPADPRSEPGWVLPPVSDDDPLGIERCSHHTFLTDKPARATEILVDILGGEILSEGRNELLGASSTYLRIGDATLEFAVPDHGTPAHQDWALDAPHDTYHSISWKVAELERAERHLEARGVSIRARSDDSIITDPTTSLGIPWGFSEVLPPGDPRGG